MDTITLSVDARGNIVVIQGRAKRARLEWYAPGLEIYVSGSISKDYPRLANQACNEAIVRNIPALSVRRVK